MKTKQLLFILLAGIFMLSGCKKDEKTNAELIVGKWAMVTSVNNYNVKGKLYNDNYTGTASDYINFGADGKYTVAEDGSSSSGTYSVKDNTITITTVDGGSTITQAMTIRTLTDNSLVLYYNDYVDANNYDEYTYTLKK